MRAINRLSAAFIDKVRRGKAEPGYHNDGGGLMLRVGATGSASFIFRFQFDYKRHDIGLGSLSAVTITEARAKAAAHRATLASGIAPTHVRRQRKNAATGLTFKQAAEACIKKRSHEFDNAKHLAQWSSTLETYAYPKLGKLDVRDIDTHDIVGVLEPIWHTKNETANRVRGRIEAVMSYAIAAKYRTADNPARWKGLLSEMLAAPSKVKTVQHQRSLPHADMREFMKQLAHQSGMGALALRFVILTASRSGPVREARWSEIDLKARVWTIPKAKQKIKTADHRVPLCDAAMAVLAALPADGREPDSLVFPGAKLGTPLSDMSLTAVIRRMGTDCVPHGFRATFKTWATECTTHNHDVVEHAYSHKVGDKVAQAYMRGDMLDRRRALFDDWGRHCV